MATIKKFQDLECWKTAQELLVSTYKILNKDELRREYSFQDQMKRATISVSNNIAEGFERSSVKEKIRFLEFASGSISEVKSMLHAAVKLNFITEVEFDSTFALAKKCQGQIRAWMKYLYRLKNS